jgi:hypothetical protein
MFFFYFVETLKQYEMNRFIHLKALQKSNELFDEAKAEIMAELEEHFKKLTYMDEHTLNIYKMGCRYSIEMLQYNFLTKLSKEQTKSLIEWPTEK